MIEYLLYNEDGHRPQLQKVVTVGDQSVPTNLNPKNKDELENVSNELISQHMNNLLSYTKSIAQTMEFFPDEEAGNKSYPINGLEEVVQISNEACEWWFHLFELSEYQGLPLVIDDETHAGLHSAGTPHVHHPEVGETYYADDAADHEHDPETGDPIYPEQPIQEEVVE